MRIESSSEIRALLHALLIRLKADTAILYKFIDEEDLEGTELLHLMSKSAMIRENKNFYSGVLDGAKCDRIFQRRSDDEINDVLDIKLREPGSQLKNLVESYEQGTIDLNAGSVTEQLHSLKKYIKVIRFCELAEMDPSERRWDFDYVKRPPKYLIVSNEILTPGYQSNPIRHEGVSAFFCRLGAGKPLCRKGAITWCPDREGGDPVSWILSREEINTCDAHSRFGEDASVFSNYDSHTAIWMLLRAEDEQRKDGKGDIIGFIRFEYYPAKMRTGGFNSLPPERVKSEGLNELKMISSLAVINVIIAEVKTVLAKHKEQSYSEQYRCLEPLMREVKEIGIGLKRKLAPGIEAGEAGAERKRLHDIHYHLEHLLYVLKRNTYYGDDIEKRVHRFLRDLIEALDLPPDIFSNAWDNLRKHEDLMLYKIDNYRDHLMHQFHVFVLGYILIHRLGIEELRRCLKTREDSSSRAHDGAGEFSDLDILRIWVLAALFHDCGYPFEKLPTAFEVFSERILMRRMPSHYSWETYILDDQNVRNILSGISKRYLPCPRGGSNYCSVELFGDLLKKAVIQNDHGAISALILMQQYLHFENGFKKVPLIDEIMNAAAFAIAIHSKSKHIKTNNQCVCMGLNPIAFILAYCDNAQEWGRKAKESAEPPKAVPSLRAIEFPSAGPPANVVDRARHFSVHLDYPSEAKGLMPKQGEVGEQLDSTIAAFITPGNYRFEIHYWVRRNRMRSFEKSFQRCGDVCGGADCIETDGRTA